MKPVSTQYPSDLTDVQWEVVRANIPPSRPVGVARQVALRAVVNAIRYRLRSGCPWRLLPHDFPHWRTVYGYYRQWQADGTWKRIEKAQRELRSQAPSDMLPNLPCADGSLPLGDTVPNPY